MPLPTFRNACSASLIFARSSFKRSLRHHASPLHRQQQVIYGIGLPRTGTKTLAATLRHFGLQGTQQCKLTDVESFDVTPEANDFLIQNSLYKQLVELKEKEDAVFILTQRKAEEWRKSMKNFEGHENFPCIEEYEKYVDELFANERERLLKVNIFEGGEPELKEIKEFTKSKNDAPKTFPRVENEAADMKALKHVEDFEEFEMKVNQKSRSFVIFGKSGCEACEDLKASLAQKKLPKDTGVIIIDINKTKAGIKSKISRKYGVQINLNTIPAAFEAHDGKFKQLNTIELTA